MNAAGSVHSAGRLCAYSLFTCSVPTLAAVGDTTVTVCGTCGGASWRYTSRVGRRRAQWYVVSNGLAEATASSRTGARPAPACALRAAAALRGSGQAWLLLLLLLLLLLQWCSRPSCPREHTARRRAAVTLSLQLALLGRAPSVVTKTTTQHSRSQSLSVHAYCRGAYRAAAAGAGANRRITGAPIANRGRRVRCSSHVVSFRISVSEIPACTYM